MSFGFSPSDLIALIQLAAKVYRDYKQSSDEFQELAKDIDDFTIILEQAREASKLVDLGAHQKKVSEKLTSRSENLLNELTKFHNEHSSLARTSPRKIDKLLWPRAKAGELRRRIYEQKLTWVVYSSSSTSASISEKFKALTELCRLIQEQTKERREEVSSLADPSASKKPESDTGWVQVAKSLEDSGFPHNVIGLVGPAYRQSASQERLQICENRRNTDAPDDDKIQIPPDDHETDYFQESFSRSSTLACPKALEQTPSSSSGDTSKSGDVKKSFFGALPRDEPLAFKPRRKGSRTESVSSENVNVNISNVTGGSRRRASMASLQKMTPNLGSSAPSIGQQRSPFGTSSAKVLRSNSEANDAKILNNRRSSSLSTTSSAGQPTPAPKCGTG